MQILANNISQSAVQMSATKADNSPKADSAFADYMDYVNTSANNSQNVDTSNIDSSAVQANSSIDSENNTDKKDKTDLLSEIALFFVNNNTGNLNNIMPTDAMPQDSDSVEGTSESDSTSTLSDLMNKIQSLIKQAEETKTDDEAESVNLKLREFVLENAKAEISTLAYPNTIDNSITQLTTGVISGPAEISNSIISQSINEIDIMTNLEAANAPQQGNDTQSINKSAIQMADLSSNKPDVNIFLTPDTESVAAKNLELKMTGNISYTGNTDTLNLSGQLQDLKNTAEKILNSIEQPTVKSVTTDTDLAVDTASLNNSQLQLPNTKMNNTNPEILDKQTNSSSDITTDSVAGATTNINAGTTNDSGGNQTGRENKQDSTQNNIIFEPSANQKEDSTIAGNNRVSKFAEYDKTGTLRIDDIPRYINKVVSGMPENGTHQATINLSPASLGKVSIEISLNGNLANIKFKAEGIDAVKSIESQLSNLKDNLAKNGIKIESVGVEQKNIDLSNSGNKGNNNPEGGNSQQNQERIKKDYLNYLRRDNLDRMTNIELSNSESLPIRGESQSNNNSLERYI